MIFMKSKIKYKMNVYHNVIIYQGFSNYDIELKLIILDIVFLIADILYSWLPLVYVIGFLGLIELHLVL